MHKAWVILLLPCSLLAQDHFREVVPPVVPRPSTAPATPELIVILTKDGGLYLQDGSIPVTLDVLGKAIAASAGEKEEHGGVEVSTATIHIRADRDAPWQHVQWILRSCAENGIRRIQFAARPQLGNEGVVDVTLPLDAAAGKVAKRAPTMNLVAHVVARKEAAARVGQQDVQKPTETAYRYGDQESLDVKELVPWAREALGAAKKSGEVVECEIEAGHKVPFAAVLAALETLRAAGVEHVLFGETKEPDADQRRAIPLPYPRRNYDDKG